ncbi:MAG: NYN domain-containing protein [Candidatus Binataceae bacterium]
MIRIAILIDGGNLRALTRQSGRYYDPNYIEKVARVCATDDEQIIRILYYDCAPYNGRVKLPISGTMQQFSGTDNWLRELARKELFAVRQGVLKFRGFRPKSVPISPGSVTDQDFEPVFEQKGVDMRIGLDIALYSAVRAVERFVLIVQDTDCIPAMKQARKAGLQVALVELPNSTLAPELLEHCDFRRSMVWP